MIHPTCGYNFNLIFRLNYLNICFLQLGFLMLTFGSCILLAGYLVPKKQVIIGHQNEMEIVDRSADNFNKMLENCKIFGLGIFSVGGTLLVAALLLPTLVGLSCFDEEADESTPFKVCIASDEEELINKRVKIPATEELKSVQPKREEEAVMTGTGLTKLQ
ncbi:Neurensin-1-like protein [Dinothrombium tinctorium]|uniref:Neurensin-1-like protein n=1 Tax=Dinothrombium tinctorium TaxID=1965070 RepID=A0A443R7F3_9ACAR|nr:Neurensin-1-like protein [Dinothrombium tinctorium]